MNKAIFSLLIAGSMAATAFTSQADITLNLDSLPTPNFTGVYATGNGAGKGSIHFTSSGGYEWQVTGGTSTPYKGNFGGTFGYDAAAGTATTSSGTFTIDTPSGALTGDLDWNYLEAGKHSADLSSDLTYTLTNLKYTGTDTTLLALANIGKADLDLSFQSVNLHTLNGTSSTVAFSATLTAVPEASTNIAGVSAVGLVLLVTAGASRRQRVTRIAKAIN